MSIKMHVTKWFGAAIKLLLILFLCSTSVMADQVYQLQARRDVVKAFSPDDVKKQKTSVQSQVKKYAPKGNREIGSLKTPLIIRDRASVNQREKIKDASLIKEQIPTFVLLFALTATVYVVWRLRKFLIR